MSACARCGGTGFEILQKDGREFARPCACRASAAKADEPSFFEASRIPLRYQHCTVDSFKPEGLKNGSSILERLFFYCNKYPFLDEREGLGLLFTGDTGVGKTHLAVAVLRELARKGARGQFWDYHDLIRQIRNSYDPDTRATELQILQPVIDVDVLLLDDLGAWKMTDWMNDTLFFIINSRYRNKRATIITTNYPDEDPKTIKKADEDYFSAKQSFLNRREYLVERVGAPLRSRLLEMCLLIDMRGDDWRPQVQKKNLDGVLRID